MTEAIWMRRRRWSWGIPAVCLILVLGRVAWSFRPLNATEQSVLGHWALELEDFVRELTLKADRHYVERITVYTASGGFRRSSSTGTWTASASVLSLFPESSSHPPIQMDFQLDDRGWLRCRDRPALSPEAIYKPVRRIPVQPDW